MVDLSRILFSFLLGVSIKRQPNVLSTQLKANGSLNLPHDLVIGNGLPRFILRNDLRLLIDFSCQIFLGEAFILSALLDHLPYFQRHSLMAELLRLSVQLGGVLGHKMLFVLSSSPFLGCFDGISLPLSRYNSLKQMFCYSYVKLNSTNLWTVIIIMTSTLIFKMTGLLIAFINCVRQWKVLLFLIDREHP